MTAAGATETSTPSGGKIFRAVLFKVPNAEDRKALIEAYKTLAETNSKNGKPYILEARASELLDDPRSQGYTVIGRTVFASPEDLKYFDEEDPAQVVFREKVTAWIGDKPIVATVKSV